MTRIAGKCESCGAAATNTVQWKKRRRLGCNRCASRARQGGSFEGPWLEARSRRDRLTPKIAALRERGKTYVEIGHSVGISERLVRKWLS